MMLVVAAAAAAAAAAVPVLVIGAREPGFRAQEERLRAEAVLRSRSPAESERVEAMLDLGNMRHGAGPRVDLLMRALQEDDSAAVRGDAAWFLLMLGTSPAARGPDERSREATLAALVSALAGDRSLRVRHLLADLLPGEVRAWRARATEPRIADLRAHSSAALDAGRRSSDPRVREAALQIAETLAVRVEGER
jgi:hypothetical protein